MPRSSLAMLLVFALTLFTSATLLFMVEPMIGKMITPLLGGTPAVWNTCMVFFQAVLLAGYAYAHASTTWLGVRKQAALHVVLMLVPFLFLPIAVNRNLIKGDENPVFLVLLILSVTVGLPMFVVSASAPMLQKWFSSTPHPAAKDPYFLYGASNLGSMLALFAYPAVVEPYLRLGQQSFDWTIGYVLLAGLTVACAVFLWKSQPVESGVKMETAIQPAEKVEQAFSTAIQPSKQGIRRGGKQPPARPTPEPAPSTALSGDVTWLRILYWVVLAFVPSSLMLGATTYITTDIAAIPLLWVVPLALYLLSFIIVFSHVPDWLQWALLVFGGALVAVLLGAFLLDLLPASRKMVRWMMYGIMILAAGGGIYGAWWCWERRDKNLFHRAMILILPLLVLGLLFFMLSELPISRHGITAKLAIHLATLFVVSMVCHGELARDRPAAKYLTGYFLWMSVGGVLGGLFNALVAPVIFTGIVEYELVMVMACFLTPPLGPTSDSLWGRRFDMILAGLFVGVAVLLISLRLHDNDLLFSSLKDSPWPWLAAGLTLCVLMGVLGVLRGKQRKFDRWMDLILPLCLGLLLVGLSWGLWANRVSPRVHKLAEVFSLNAPRFRKILTYGVPIVLCYTFVERQLRFGLGVAFILLASTFCTFLESGVDHQERSFFGVLKIEHEGYRYGEDRFIFRRLVHGTTLHGMQFLNEDRRDEPLTYYHRTGPIGEVMMEFNGPDTPPEKMNLAVIGLGTGTMACYARKGQHLTFYDIDPIVKRFSFDEGDPDNTKNGPFFSYVSDARKRGAELELVMGDARLTMERKKLTEAEKYGVIVVDAFSSDAIPVHLITLEAVDVYLDKLAEDGLLCFHISNRYLDLKPVLYNLAQERGLKAVYQSDDHEDDAGSSLLGKSSSTWVMLCRHQKPLDRLLALNNWEKNRTDFRIALLPMMFWPDPGMGLTTEAMFMRNLMGESLFKRPAEWKELKPPSEDKPEPHERPWPNLKSVGVWTDDYSNLLSVFSW